MENPTGKNDSREDRRRLTLDHMIDEKFGEIFFIAKEEFYIKKKSEEEQKLYDMLERFKEHLKFSCKHHFKNDNQN